MDLAVNASAAPWIAAQASPWPGRLSLLKRSGASSFDFNRLIEAQATMGNLLTPLVAGPQHVFDRGSSFDVKLKYGALSSVTELEVLGGANIAAIGDDVSGYEIVQFASAELIAASTYRVKTLLRGQGGSAAEMLGVRPALSNFVLLNGAVVQPILSVGQALSESTWRAGPAELDHGHSSYLEFSSVGKAKGLRPLSPCQLALKKDGGDLVLNWIRRTRVDGDGWEASEAYRVEIFSGATVMRSVTVNTPTYRYPAADIATDFGSLPASLVVGVAQISATTGPGTKLMRTLNV
jgi:hypothetical protein